MKTLISLTKDCDDSLSSISIEYNSDKDPAYVANCEFKNCTQEVFSFYRCFLKLACWDRFQEEVLGY